eukprot:9473893-Pyramimonas_sp.AAC.1
MNCDVCGSDSLSKAETGVYFCDECGATKNYIEETLEQGTQGINDVGQRRRKKAKVVQAGEDGEGILPQTTTLHSFAPLRPQLRKTMHIHDLLNATLAFSHALSLNYIVP